MKLRQLWRRITRTVTNQPLLTTVVGGMLVLGCQIGWDWYSDKRELTLTYQSSVVLANPTDARDSLRFLFGEDTIHGLTRLALSLTNTGRIPITTEEISVPPFVQIDSGTILVSRIEARTPPESNSTLTRDSLRGRVSIRAPLMNPGDRIDFAIFLPESRIPSLSSGMHARGFRGLTFIDDRTANSTRRGWFSLNVILFLLGEAYLLLNLTVLLLSAGYERRARKTWTGGFLKSRSGMTAGQFGGVTQTLFPEHPALLQAVQSGLSGRPLDEPLPVDIWASLSAMVTQYADDLRHKLTNAAILNIVFMMTVAIYFIWITR